MRMMILAACAALALSGCAGVGSVPVSPAPLQQTTADEKTLNIAYAAFEVALTAIDGLRDTGMLVKGTPDALRVQSLIRTVQKGLNTARAVQKGLSTDDPIAALAASSAALAEITIILKGLK